MTFIELILFLAGRGEKIVSNRVNEILTTQHRYHRVAGDLFTRDTEEGALDTVYTKGGTTYVWRKRMEVDVPVIPLTLDDKAMGLVPVE